MPTISIVTEGGVRKRIDPDDIIRLVTDNFTGKLKVVTTSFPDFITDENVEDLLTRINDA